MKRAMFFFFLVLLSTSTWAQQTEPLVETGEPITHDLHLLPGKDSSALTQKIGLLMTTSEGEIVIEVYPEAAPNAAKRFVELAESGYYDNTPVSRVVDKFVAQFGINWREPHREWKEKNFDDDPSIFALETGTLAFAKAGPNTNSTQVFINLRENNRLADPSMNFTTFGKVVKGMDVVAKFVRVGDPSGGLDQGRLWRDGESYIRNLRVKPTVIESVVVQYAIPALEKDVQEEESEKTSESAK